MEHRGAGTRLGALAILGAWAAGGCALAFQSPTVSVAEVRLASMSLTGGTLGVLLEVENPNGYALESQDFRYAFSFADGGAGTQAWVTLAEGRVPGVVRIPAREKGTVELSVPFDVASLGSAVGLLLRRGELEYRFTGELRAGTPLGAKRIPFDLKGLFRP